MKNHRNKIKDNKFLVVFILYVFLFTPALSYLNFVSDAEAADFGMSVDFLIKVGLSFYDQGRLFEAKQEMEKALLINPRSAIAKEFLQSIDKKITQQQGHILDLSKDEKLSVIEQALEQAQLAQSFTAEISVPTERKMPLPIDTSTAARGEAVVIAELFDTAQAELPPPEQTIILSGAVRETQPDTLIELTSGSAVVIQGDQIGRFLNTAPEIVDISRIDDNSILVRAKEAGTGIFHIWDNNGRWTFSYKWIHRALTKAYREAFERRVLEEQFSQPFKLGYSFDWGSFYSGESLGLIERRSLYFNQNLSLRGETPYGRYYANTSINRLNKEYRITTLSMSLTDGNFAGLRDFHLGLFDIGPGFSGYKFPSAGLRGVSFGIPMFDQKLYYNTFWGGIPEGDYTNLSPGLGRTRDAYLRGVGLLYNFSRNSNYKFYYASTYGSELSSPVLTNRAFGAGAFYRIGKLSLSPEIAYDDAGHISYTAQTNLSMQKVNMSLYFTEDDRDFVSPLGGAPSGGSTSIRYNFNYLPFEDLRLSSSIAAVRDRRLFNPEDARRPNYDFDTTLRWLADPMREFELGYTRYDSKGSISPSLNQAWQMSMRQQLFFVRRLNTYLNYSHSRGKNFTGATANFIRNSISGGVSFRLVGDLYYSLSKRINFIENVYTGETASPHVLETSLHYSSRIFDSPFYGRFRISYRDEEGTDSPIAFLSGEDRLEFQASLDYRPSPNWTGFLSCRVANVWPEQTGAPKRLDLDVRYGLRLVWDTNFRWNTKGHVQGFVFYDANANGLRDKDEEGVEGVAIIAQQDKSSSTNERGYYKINNVVGKKTDVSIDLKSLPYGYTFTTPISQEVALRHGGFANVDFGITTRSEIFGVVFIDQNGNNVYDKTEEVIGNVAIIFNESNRIITDGSGQFLFRNIMPGKHTIEIDLKTLPTKYIPKIPLKKEIIVEEGSTFRYDVPLRVANIP